AAGPCTAVVAELAYLYCRLCPDHHARQGRRGTAQRTAKALARALPRQPRRPAQRTLVRPDCRRDPDARRPDTVPASAANALYRYRGGTGCTGGDFATAVAGKPGRFFCAASLSPGPGVASCLRHAVAGTTLQQPRYAGAGN